MLLTATMAYRLAMQAESVLLDYGEAIRTISNSLFNALFVRDRHCRFPGCDRPPQWCQGHHGHHVADHGPTKLGNLALFCTRHHHLIHKQGWKCKVEEDGTVHVTYPDGTVRTTR